MRNRTKLIAAGVAISGVAFVAGCGTTGIDSLDDPRGKGDAPVTAADDSGAYVTNMPNGFGNIATKCLNGAPGFRVAVTTRGVGDQGVPASMVIVPDEACRG
jgi:hypothetical protein